MMMVENAREKRLPKKFFFYFLLTIATIFWLQACKGNAQLEPEQRPTPSRSAPTSTSSDILPSQTSTSPPTPIVSNQVTLSSYIHSTNRFSINHPATWEFFERPDGVVFVEPGDHAGYSVMFRDVGKSYSERELNQYLITFVAENFLDEGSNFTPISQEQYPDGSVVAQFSSLDPNLGQAVNEVRVSQENTIVFILLLSVIEEQWPISQNRLQDLVESFTPLDTRSVIDSQPTAEPPVWMLIGPENKEFGFLYASDWEVLHQDKNSVMVALPSSDMIFTASNFVWPNAINDPQAAEKAALAHLKTLSKKYNNVQNLPPTEFPLDTATGITIDFLYTTDDGQDLAGSVITAVNNGKMYKIVFTAPTAIYEAALQWFNPMYKSFKFLMPEEFLEELQPTN